MFYSAICSCRRRVEVSRRGKTLALMSHLGHETKSIRKPNSPDWSWVCWGWSLTAGRLLTWAIIDESRTLLLSTKVPSWKHWDSESVHIKKIGQKHFSKCELKSPIKKANRIIFKLLIIKWMTNDNDNNVINTVLINVHFLFQTKEPMKQHKERSKIKIKETSIKSIKLVSCVFELV